MSVECIWQGRCDAEETGDSRRFYQQITQHKADYGILGFACDLGVQANLGRVGAQQAPDAVRAQLANLAWHEGDKKIRDFGNLVAKTSLIEAQDAMSKRIVQALQACSKRVLVLGGGHETAFASLSALHNLYFGKQAIRAEKLGIINFDAHFDLRLPSVRGVSSGTPFYQAKQLFKEDFHYCCVGVSEESNTQALFHRADEYGVCYLLDKHIRQDNMEQICYFLQKFCEDKTQLYISLDLDVLPHYQAPGVSAPAVRGVRLDLLEQMLSFIQNISKKQGIKIPLVEVSELNPKYDRDNLTAKTAAILAKQLLVGQSGITLGV